MYGTTAGKPAKHNLKTGSQVPVEIVAEVDRKVDDGLPDAGGFQFSTFGPEAPADRPPQLASSPARQSIWAINLGNTNCGGASLF